MRLFFVLLLTYLISQQKATDFEVANTGNTLDFPKVFGTTDGGFVIICSEGTVNNILLTRYAADQTVLNATFDPRATTGQTASGRSDVIQLADGSFIVAFAEVNTDYDIMIRSFDSDLEPTGAEYVVLNVTTGVQEGPDIQPLPSGGFVMVFEGENISGGNGKDIGLKVFNAALEYDQAVMVTDSLYNNDQINPRVCVLSDGRYIVVWQDYDGNYDGSGDGIYARRYEADHTPNGTEFLVNVGHIDPEQVIPDIFALANDDYVIVYQYHNAATNWNIWAKIYTSDHEVYEDSYMVHSVTTGIQRHVGGFGLSDGGFIVLIRTPNYDSGTLDDVVAVRYDSDYAFVEEYIICEDRVGDQGWPRGATLEDGGYVIAWVDVGDITATRKDFEHKAVDLASTALEEIDASTVCSTGYVQLRIYNSGDSVVHKATWTAVSGQSNSTRKSEFEDFVADFDRTDDVLQIPISLIDAGITYTVTGTFLTVDYPHTILDPPMFTNLADNSCTCPGSALYNHDAKFCRADDIPSPVLRIRERQSSTGSLCIDQTLFLDLDDEEIEFLGGYDSEVTWSFTSDPSQSNSALTNLLDLESGLTVHIPADILDFDVEYTFFAQTQYSDQVSNVLEPANDISCLDIFAFNQDGFDLLVIADLSSGDFDFDDVTTTYVWECKQAETTEGPFTEDCDDPQGIFGVEIEGDSQFIIPGSYRGNGFTFEVTVALKDGDVRLTADTQIVNSFITLEELLTPTRCLISLSTDVSPVDRERSIEYNWEVAEADVTDADKYEDLLAVVKDNKGSSTLQITREYIERGVTYSFTVWFENVNGFNISDTIELSRPIPNFPELTVQGGLEQEVLFSQQNVIKVNLECQPASLTYEWDQASGPTSLDIDDYIKPSLLTWLTIPACELQTDSTYEISFEVEIPSESISTSIDIVLNVLADEFTTLVDGASSKHPYDEDLEVSASIVATNSCPIDVPDYTYEWTCLIGSPGNYVSCDNSDGIFNNPTNDPEILIPKSTYDQGETLSLTVETTLGSYSTSSVGYVEISEANVIPITISCKTVPCAKYSKTVSTTFKITSQNTAIDFKLLNYVWNIAPDVSRTSFLNELTLLKNTGTISFEYVYIDVVASNSTNYGTATYQLAVNTPPTAGSFSVSPVYGQSLKTIYNLTATGWSDDDIPLTYQFYYSFENKDSSYEIISNPKKSIYTETFLTSSKVNMTMYLKVAVRDIYTAKSEAFKTVIVDKGQFTSASDQTAEISSILTSVSEFSDPEAKIEQISKISNQMKQLSTEVNTNNNDGPECNGNGKKQNGVCVCNPGYTSTYCGVTEEEFDDIVNTKVAVLDQISQSVDSLGEDVEPQMVLDSIADISSEPNLNSDESITKVEGLLDGLINSETKRNLTEEESAKTYTTLNNIIGYAGESDCNATGNITDSMRNKTLDYLESVAKSYFAQTVVGGEPLIENTELYDIFMVKTTPCQLFNIKIDFGNDESPKVRLLEEYSEEYDCNQIIHVEVYAFNGRIFNCEADQKTQYKEELIIKVTDAETGEELEYFDTAINYPSKECDAACEEGFSGECRCEDLSIFGAVDQISQIFSNSELADALTNFDLSKFEDWEFYSSVPFWVIFVMTVGFGVVTVVLLKFMKNYCLMEKLEQMEKPSLKRVFGTAFLVVHPLLNVFFIKRAESPKMARNALLYARMLFILLFVGNFGPLVAVTDDSSSRRVLQTSTEEAEGGETSSSSSGESFNPYVLIIPYFTFIPLIILLESLICLSPEEIPPEATPEEIRKLTKKNKQRKCLKIFGYCLMGTLVAISIFLMFLIDVNYDNNKRINWVVGYAQSIAQDWLITPLLFVFVQMHQINENIQLLLKKKELAERLRKEKLNKQNTKVIPLDASQLDQSDLSTVKEGSSISPMKNSSRVQLIPTDTKKVGQKLNLDNQNLPESPVHRNTEGRVPILKSDSSSLNKSKQVSNNLLKNTGIFDEGKGKRED